MKTPSRSLKFRLRLLFSWALRVVLRFRASRYESPGRGPALVIAPHPDDESFGCGGWIARQRAGGRSIHVLYLTDGSASHPGHPVMPAWAIEKLRNSEARIAASKLQLEPAALHFFNLPDGQLARLEPTVAIATSRRLRNFVRELNPAEILLPRRDDGSSEHEAAFRLVNAALAELPVSPRILQFPVWSWWSPSLAWRLLFSHARVYRCRFPRQLALKHAALSAYRSQTAPLAPQTHSALPEGFVALFSAPEEYFFEN